MSNDQHTPGPWKQGRLLMTSRTRSWSISARNEGDAYERKRVFSNFTDSDQGRSRRLICVCERQEDAELIARAPELQKENETLLLAQKGNLARLDELNALVEKIWQLFEIPTSMRMLETIPLTGKTLFDFIKETKQENDDLRKLCDELLPPDQH